MKSRSRPASWAVYLGEPTPTSAKVSGRLSVTDSGVVFDAGTALAANAGLLLGLGIAAHRLVHDAISIPFAEIAAARAERTKFILRTLALRLVSGEEVAFQFGVASPAAALASIQSRLAR
ncbi:MAG: hypothetical protein PHX77_01760 [Candidatus Bipolaricaulis sp.]|nr:hypothetical protein [Candidatus Bipolaricaulis sp.]MDD5646788.1 hypothetical protein [Candidatus Bipolaricaulis sp.]